jgi:CubicO group peptidase (beta-lactamase class C family)
MRTHTIVVGLVSLVILAVLALVLLPHLRKPEQVFTQFYWPTNGWRTSTPEEQGFDSAQLAESLQGLRQERVPIDSLLIIRNGYVVLDAYFYPYEASFPHNLASVTKSVTTALVGIAAEQGKLQLDRPMVAYFPNRTIANLDDRKRSITVRHLAGMVNGMSSGCLVGDVPTLEVMSSSPDWVQAALDREITTEPGKIFCYDSPGMHLLSAILQETTGMTELEFARQYLFEPLGIQDVYWESDPQGYTHGWGDLWLKPPDAAKIGYLFLNHGVWEGKQIVPSDWVAEAVKTQSTTGTSDDYGYGWWVADDSYFAQGRLGQYVRVYPAANAVVVITARGFDYKTIEPVLGVAYVSPDKPLPANPEGAAKLNALLTELTQGQGSEPVISPPALAREVSGKAYDCEPNAVDVTQLRIEFIDPAEAKLYISKKDGADVIWPIGLDGKYRMCPEWKGLRGYWQDAQTFTIQAFYNLGPLNRQLQFKENRMVVNLPDMSLKFSCRVQNP